MIKTNNIELWEIMKDGKDGEVFEVTDCLLPDYLGHKVKVQANEDYRGSYKCLIKPDATGNGQDALAMLYGCLGTAKFKKVEEYEQISFIEVIERLNDFKMVYILSGGEYEDFSRYKDFCDFYIEDMSDLMGRSFFIKQGE